MDVLPLRPTAPPHEEDVCADTPSQDELGDPLATNGSRSLCMAVSREVTHGHVARSGSIAEADWPQRTTTP